MIARLLRRFPWLEPWYDWGPTLITRLDQIERDFSDETEGPARYFEIQWLGFHFSATVGRVPPMASPALVAERKLVMAKAEVRS